MKNTRMLFLMTLLVLMGEVGRAGAQTLTTLYSFSGGADGANPETGLVQGSDSNFYGTTSSGDGTVFKISPAGALTTLETLGGGLGGQFPYAGLVQGSDGNVYRSIDYTINKNTKTITRNRIVTLPKRS